MSPLAIAAIVYAAGLVGGLFYVGAAGISFTATSYLDLFGPAWLVLVWPLAAPVVAGKHLREAISRRAERRAAIEAEHRKWLEEKI